MVVSVSNSTKQAPPLTGRRLARIAEVCLPKALQKDYDLSIAFIGRAAARRLNRESRGKDYATNILSFTYGPKEGELVLNLDRLSRDARELGFRSRADVATYLLAHGLLHLVGHDHGAKMDAQEDAAMSALGVRRID